MKSKLLNLLSSCANCGSVFRPREPFCKYCWRQLEKLILPAKQREKQVLFFKTYSLVDWNSHLVTKLIYSLKGGGQSTKTFEYLANIFISTRKLALNEVIIIPSPAKNPAKKDHAIRFADALGEILDVPVFNPLRRVKESEQKKLSIRERQDIELKLVGSDIKPKSTQKLVFVDDVLTTGATAMAAYRALGAPKNFEVWTIAYRPYLA